jgi:hypothetical protein
MKQAEIARGSAWKAAAIDEFLSVTNIPCRLACVTGDGFPHVSSLWYLYDNDALWFSVQRRASVHHWLSNNSRVGFEIAGDSPPYFGVRGRGTANLLAAAEVDVLPRLLDRYGIDRDSSLASWLLSRRATELTIKLMPEWITSWDYRDRMS